jgi:hypothetical protein
MGFAFEKQPKPENYLTTINRFKTTTLLNHFGGLNPNFEQEDIR